MIIVDTVENRAHPFSMGTLTFFRSGRPDEEFDLPQESLLDLPPQFTMDELSSQLLSLLLKSSKCMAQLAIFAGRATSTEEKNQIIEECLIFHWWYLDKLSEGRKGILISVQNGFREFLWDVQAIREQIDHFQSKSENRHLQYGDIFRGAGGGIRLAENVAPFLVGNLLSSSASCLSILSLQSGITDCIQTFARLIFQALSVPVKPSPPSPTAQLKMTR